MGMWVGMCVGMCVLQIARSVNGSLAPQGALQRPLGGRLPAIGQMPFRTLIGRHPSAPEQHPLEPPPPTLTRSRLGDQERHSAIRSTLGLTHSRSAPGYM